MDHKKRDRSRSKNTDSMELEEQGRKGRLDEHTLSYYRRVNQTLNDGFTGGTDEKEIFLKNVFSTLCEEALPVSQNQTASNIVELLLHEADLSQLVEFGSCISKDWETACSDRIASHVTQTFILQLAKLLVKQPESMPAKTWKETQAKALDIVMELYGFLMSMLAFHMQNIYTSHIVRVMLEVLAGMQVSERVIRSRSARQNKGAAKDKDDFEVYQSDDHLKLLLEMCQKIADLKMIKDHIKNNLSNPVLQTMILVLHEKDNKRCRKVCKKLIEETTMFELPEENEGENIRLPDLVQHEIGSHFVEQILAVASSDTINGIIDTVKPIILPMAVHPVANFVLQKLIKSVHNSDQFEVIFKKLSHHVEDILGMNHPQVVVSLTEGCVKYGTKQDSLLKSLQKAFHCYSPVERQTKCVPLFASLNAYETFYKSLTKPEEETESDSESSDNEKEVVFPLLTNVNYHGSLLLQQLLKFGNPKLIVSSFLEMKSAEVRNLSCDPCGSHVMDVFMKSSSVSQKSRDMLCQRLKGLYVELACHKHGSRTLDALFDLSPMQNKLNIAEELGKHKTRMCGEKFGRIIWYKYSLDNFLRNKEQWKQIQGSKDKKRKMFEEIFQKSAESKKRKVKQSYDADEESSSLRLQEPEEDLGFPSTKHGDDQTRTHKHGKVVEQDADPEADTERDDPEHVVKKKKKKKRKNDSEDS